MSRYCKFNGGLIVIVASFYRNIVRRAERASKPLLNHAIFDGVDGDATPALAELIGEILVHISPNIEIQRPGRAEMDAPRSPLSVGGFMVGLVDFCVRRMFCGWQNFDGHFSPKPKFCHRT